MKLFFHKRAIPMKWQDDAGHPIKKNEEFYAAIDTRINRGRMTVEVKTNCQNCRKEDKVNAYEPAGGYPRGSGL